MVPPWTPSLGVAVEGDAKCMAATPATEDFNRDRRVRSVIVGERVIERRLLVQDKSFAGQNIFNLPQVIHVVSGKHLHDVLHRLPR